MLSPSQALLSYELSMRAHTFRLGRWQDAYSIGSSTLVMGLFGDTRFNPVLGGLAKQRTHPRQGAHLLEHGLTVLVLCPKGCCRAHVHVEEHTRFICVSPKCASRMPCGGTVLQPQCRSCRGVVLSDTRPIPLSHPMCGSRLCRPFTSDGVPLGGHSARPPPPSL